MIRRSAPYANLIITEPAPSQVVKRRALPSSLVRSFSVFRDGYAVEAIPITHHPSSISSLWLVPELHQTCIEDGPRAVDRFGRGGGRSGGCVPNSMALAGELTLGLFGRGETILGLAANGNRTVTLTVVDRKTNVVSREVVPVSQNVYAAYTPHLFETATLKDSTGTLKTIRLP